VNTINFCQKISNDKNVIKITICFSVSINTFSSANLNASLDQQQSLVEKQGLKLLNDNN